MNVLTSIVLSFLITNARSRSVDDSKINLLRENLGLNYPKRWDTGSTTPSPTDPTAAEPFQGAKFMCRTSGMYPDPFDCHKYHHCARNSDGWTQSPLEHFSDTCDYGYAYNARTTFCDISLRNGTCNTEPIPKCSHQGQNGVMEYNPSVYYICQYYPNGPLYPFMYACENGKKYNTYLYLCE